MNFEVIVENFFFFFFFFHDMLTFMCMMFDEHYLAIIGHFLSFRVRVEICVLPRNSVSRVP